MRALVFHNPTAGGGLVSEKELLAACRLAGFSAVYRSTKDDDIAKALKKSVDIVVAAGGDGTVARILRKVAGRKLPVGVVPLGNANNIARSLGISGLPQELAETWSLGHTRPLNIGIATGPWGSRRFVEAVGVRTVCERHQKRQQGQEAGRGQSAPGAGCTAQGLAGRGAARFPAQGFRPAL